MEARACCDGMSAELMAWKDRVNDVMRKFDAASCGEKQWVVPYINDLHIIVAELDDKIQSLNRECEIPGEPEGKQGFVPSNWDEVWHSVSPGDVGG